MAASSAERSVALGDGNYSRHIAPGLQQPSWVLQPVGLEAVQVLVQGLQQPYWALFVIRAVDPRRWPEGVREVALWKGSATAAEHLSVPVGQLPPLRPVLPLHLSFPAKPRSMAPTAHPA